MQPLVLIAEDETAIATLLEYNLVKAGFDVKIFPDGQQLLNALQQQDAKAVMPDIILLDWMLPVLSGIETCKAIRKNVDTAMLPIIMITARGEEEDRIAGLETGADDYITKPFSPKELVARMRALLRRSKPSEVPEDLIKAGDLSMDNRTKRAWRGHGEQKRELVLGPTEFRLLRHFMRHPEEVFSREQLLAAAWKDNVYVEDRTVDVHIRRLRKVLNKSNEPDIIRTVRSAGYSLVNAS